MQNKSKLTLRKQKSPHRTQEQSQAFDFSEVFPVEASPSLVLRGFVASLRKRYEVSVLNPQILRVWAAFCLYFKSGVVSSVTLSFSSPCREQAGEIKMLGKLLKMTKRRPEQRDSGQTMVSLLAGPPATLTGRPTLWTSS